MAQINQQKQGLSALNPTFLSQIKGNIHWQGILWRALVDDVQRDFGGKAKHRAALNQQFLALCRDPNATLNLPERIFIFGIPALPTVYLNIFPRYFQLKQMYIYSSIIHVKNIGAICEI